MKERIPAGGRALLADVTADPRAPLVVAVSGPAGTGKTCLLNALADVYTRAGVRVHRTPLSADGQTGIRAPLPTDGVVLVDDAHLLGDAAIADLTSGPTRLVIAYRPWPAIAGLHGLERTRPEVRLGHLDPAGIADTTGSPDVTEIHARTGGVPALVRHAADGRSVDLVTAELDRLPTGVRDTLLTLALGGDPTLLHTPADAVTDALNRAWSAGLLDAAGDLIGLAAEVLTATTNAVVLRDLKRRIAESHLNRGGPTLPTARLLLDVGARGADAAAVLEAAGDEALADSAALAVDLFDGAVAAGAPPARLAARRAEAAVLSGDVDGALRLADVALSDGTDSDRAASVAAAALAQRGMLAGSAALSGSTSAGAAVTALIGVGDLPAAQRELAALAADGPGLAHGVQSLVARGVHHTVTGQELVGLSELVQATRLIGAQPTLLPESPAALAALVAIHIGEPDVAERILARQPRSTRCRLLGAWVALQRGDLATVEATLATCGGSLEPRDELYAAALALGTARRNTDLTGLMTAWPRAREAVLAHAVDLYVLQPLGEIAVAAAKLREDHVLAAHLHTADELLGRLGRPPLWSGPVHWYGLHAAIAAESPQNAGHHARSLHVMAAGGRCAAALATASGSWLRVLAGEVDVPAVTAAARDLHTVGLSWDAARLAGQAAVRTTDRKAMATLLSFARALQVQPERQEPGRATLSNREREVAALLVAGMTYKQIGERLFVSAKTVEHHIARIKRRLGDPSRKELLARLRAMVGDTN